MATAFARSTDRAAAPAGLGRLVSLLPWLTVVALVTLGLVAARGTLDKAHAALAYLLVVLTGTARLGRTDGAILAVLCFLTFNFFLLPPYHTLIVADPLDWLVLVAFLLTSLVAGWLLHRAQAEAEAARQRAEQIDRLATRAEALREADRLKDALIASVSHDLRTPLTTIKALAHELRIDGDDRAAIIELEADRLNRFVADLLDLSRLNAGGLTMQPELNAADDLLGAALERLAGMPRAADLCVRLETAEPLVGRFDFAHSLRALVNLIENALKYSPAGSRVEIEAGRAGDELVFSVLDRGPGIPVADAGHIFDPFFRAGGAAPDAGGAGLGLAIARRLAKAQDGTISYAPRPGGGSIFTLRLPAVDIADLSTGSS